MEDYVSGFSKLSIAHSKKKLIEIAEGKRGKNLAIPEDLYNKLYDYQKEGVRWLFSLYERGKGGILGDDMGLGKTVQIISFVTGMIECKFIRCVLIIAPMSVINVWVQSLKDFSPRINVATFHGDKRAREKALERIQDRGGLLIATYDLVGREGERLGRDGYGDEFTWDYVIADEGHLLKNKSIKRSQGAHLVPTKFRLILTGTPLQNKLPELWALFDFTHFGQLLGSMRTFNSNYGHAIEEGRKKCASARAQALGNEFAESLRKIIEPYLLRRTKDEVGLNSNSRPSSSAVSTADGANSSASEDNRLIKNPSMPKLPRKNDFVVWLTLSKEQEDIYRRFLTTDEVKYLLDPSVKTSPLTQLIILKKLCDHPRLLSENACQILGLTFDPSMGENQDQMIGRVPSATSLAEEVDDLARCINQSIKTSFLGAILPNLVDSGHKVLVFSMSLRMLNLVAQILKNRLNIKFLRLDGGITKLDERQRIIEKFQTSNKYKVLLLTTQVGGVGLTLTAADRVIIVDPAWNPAVDSQAVDRVYRVGQKNNVVIYRLITAGTVEEKIYRRQVFKQSIFKQIAHSSKGTLSSNNMDDPTRYFTHQDLRELFKLSDTKSSETQRQLADMHAHERVSDEQLDEHVNYVTSINGVVGISDHDLLFTKHDDGENNVADEETKRHVERAKQMMELEIKSGSSADLTQENRVRKPFAEKQLEPKGSLYPRGFGATTASNAFQARPYEEMMQLPSELPLYLQKKGLVKAGQNVFTPPKLIGRGQKESSINLHRSYSDGELNAAAETNDGTILLSDSEEEDNNDTASLNESRIQSNIEKPARKPSESDVNHLVDLEAMDEDGDDFGGHADPVIVLDEDADENMTDGLAARPASNTDRPSTASTQSAEVIELPTESDEDDQPEVAMLPQILGQSLRVSAQAVPPSSENDSLIQVRRKTARKVVDSDSDDDGRGDTGENLVGADRTPRDNVIVIDVDGNEGEPSYETTNSLGRNIGVGTTSNETSSFAETPINASTPFNPGVANLKHRQNKPSALAISPLIVRNSRSLTTDISNVNRGVLAEPEQQHFHGVKRPQHERSVEILDSLEARDNPASFVEATRYGEVSADGDNSNSTAPTEDCDLSESGEVVDETADIEESSSRISLPKGSINASYGY